MSKKLVSSRIPIAIGSYSAARKINSLIFTSGQLPINPESGTIENIHDIEMQTKQSLINIQSLLEDNNSSMDQIIKTTVFLKEINDFSKFDNVYRTFFNNDFPARTAIFVNDLPMNALIEIEVIAEVKEKK